MHLGLATLAGAGSHIVASRALYGGSHNLLAYTLPRFGVETTFVNPRDLDAWRKAIRPNTKCLFGETLGNPGLDVLNIPALAQIAHEHRIPLFVDATFRRRISALSTSVPTSFHRRRRSSADTASRSAASWWTAAPSTGRPRGSFRS
jgi:O-acetylhomoserine/O-acetylserine sulfhydrylase-like pyridoxal-dependent enzyme